MTEAENRRTSVGDPPVQQNEIKAFYDEFMSSRMLDYRLRGSKRLSLARDLVAPCIKPHSVVLDVGCGIGIITEGVGRIARRGRVVGVDISGRNIWYARQSVRRRNVTFLEADVVADIERIRTELGRPADVIVMIDTIEHIEEQERPKLLRYLSDLGTPSAILIVTLPSPHYQRHLLEHDPEELQIVDNVIEPEVLFTEAGSAGFHAAYFSLVDAGRHNQYAHCVFRRSIDTDPVEWSPRAMIKRLPGKVGSVLMRPLRYYRYQRRIFSDTTGDGPLS